MENRNTKNDLLELLDDLETTLNKSKPNDDELPDSSDTDDFFPVQGGKTEDSGNEQNDSLSSVSSAVLKVISTPGKKEKPKTAAERPVKEPAENTYGGEQILNELFEILKTEPITEKESSADIPKNKIKREPPKQKTVNAGIADEEDGDVKIYGKKPEQIHVKKTASAAVEKEEPAPESAERRTETIAKTGGTAGGSTQKRGGVPEMTDVPRKKKETDYDSLLTLIQPDEETHVETGFGEESGGETHKNIFADKSAKKKNIPRNLFEISSKEYKDRSQNTEIFDRYKNSYRKEFIKLICCTVLFLIEFYIELAPFFGFKLPAIVNVEFYNFIYILVDLQVFFIVSYFCMRKSLLYGIRCLINNVFNIHAVSVIFFMTTFVHTLLTYNMKYNKPGIYLFNSVTLFCFIIVLVNNIMILYKELMCFSVISSKRNKYYIKTVKKTSIEKKYLDDYIFEGTNVGTVCSVDFINNFFKNVSKEENTRLNKIFTVISLALSVVYFAVMMALKVDPYRALTAIAVFILVSLPLCSGIVRIIPTFLAQKRMQKDGTAVIGDESYDFYSKTSVLSVYDTDLFPPELVKIARLRVYGENRIDTVLQHLCCLFEKIKSPLYEKFKASTTFDSKFDKNITVMDTADDGIFFESNKTKFFIGSGEYISNLSLSLPIDENFDAAFEKSSGSIMYLATEKEVVAKICAIYEITPDFAEIVKTILRLNIGFGVRTLDPNVNDNLIKKSVLNKRVKIKIIRLKDFKDVRQLESSADSGLVSKSSLKNLVNALFICHRAKNIVNSNILIKIIAYVLGVLITTVMIFFGRMSTVFVLHIMLFQIFWTLPIIFISSIYNK